MPTLLHEAPLLLLEERPVLLLDLISQLAKELPSFEEIRMESADHTKVMTLEGRSDRVAVFYRTEVEETGARQRRPVLAIINESQTGIDEEKWWT